MTKRTIRRRGSPLARQRSRAGYQQGIPHKPYRLRTAWCLSPYYDPAWQNSGSRPTKSKGKSRCLRRSVSVLLSEVVEARTEVFKGDSCRGRLRAAIWDAARLIIACDRRPDRGVRIRAVPSLPAGGRVQCHSVDINGHWISGRTRDASPSRFGVYLSER